MEREPVKPLQHLSDEVLNILTSENSQYNKQVLSAIASHERNILFQLAQRIFHRDPTPEELSLFKIFATPGMIDSFNVAFKEIIIGEVNRKLTGATMQMEFTPNHDFPIIGI